MPAQEKVGGKATAKRRMPDGITLPIGDNSGPETAKRRRRLQQPNTSLLDAAASFATLATLATHPPSSPPDRKSAHAVLTVDEEDEEDAEEEVEEHDMADGTTVLKGSDGTLYDLESFDAIGEWNSEDNTFIDNENIAATSAGASADAGADAGAVAGADAGAVAGAVAGADAGAGAGAGTGAGVVVAPPLRLCSSSSEEEK